MRSRIRSIKPEALADEALWDAEAATGLPLFRAFTGLWCYADREGRFEWRPRTLGKFILPHWIGDFEAVLNALAPHFVQRYEVGGRVYGHVRNFHKHQKPNHREPPSECPAPPDDACERLTPRDPGTPGHARAGDLGTPVSSGKGTEGNGREREHGAPAAPGEPLAPSADDEALTQRTLDELVAQVGGAYKRRFEAARNIEWVGLDINRRAFETIARFVHGQARREKKPVQRIIHHTLDRCFEHTRMAANDWPPKWLAESIASIYAGEQVNAKDAAEAYSELAARLQPEIDVLETKLRMRRSKEGPDAAPELQRQIEDMRAELARAKPRRPK